MTKKDLKNGMIIECRNGNRYMVLDDVCIRQGGIFHMSSITKDLGDTGGNSEWIIDKIYLLHDCDTMNDIFKDECLKLIWNRNSFNKKDLKNGAVVTTKEGDKYIKIDNTLINLKTGYYLDLDDYTDDLRNKSAYSDKFDILSVDNVKDYDKYTHRPYYHYINK